MSMEIWEIIFLRATTGTNFIVDALPTIWQSFMHLYPADLEITTMKKREILRSKNRIFSVDVDRHTGIIFLRATTGTNLFVDALPTIWQSFMHLYRAVLEILTMKGYELKI